MASGNSLNSIPQFTLYDLVDGMNAQKGQLAVHVSNANRANVPGATGLTTTLTEDSSRRIVLNVLRRADEIQNGVVRNAHSLVEQDKTVNKWLALLMDGLVAPQIDVEGAGDTRMIPAAWEKLKLALEAFEKDAAAPGGKEQVLQACKDVAAAVRNAANVIVDTRAKVKDDAKTKVDRINELLKGIGELNKRIANHSGSTEALCVMKDQRDQKLTELAGLIKIEVIHDTPDPNHNPDIKTCEVFIAAKTGLTHRSNQPGNAVPAHRKLVDKDGGTMTFSWDAANGRVDAWEINDPNRGVAGRGIGDQNAPHLVVGADRSASSFSWFLRRNGGALAADLCVLDSRAGQAPVKETIAGFRGLGEYELALNTFVNSLVAQFDGLDHNQVFGSSQLFALGPVPPPPAPQLTDFCVNPDFANTPQHLDPASANPLVQALTAVAPRLDPHGGNANPPQRTFEDFWRQLCVEGLGRDEERQQETQKVDEAYLHDTEQIRNAYSSIDPNQEEEEIAKIVSYLNFQQNILQLLLTMYGWAAKLLERI
ncbi:hypothetical protein FACS189481_3560 [Clostridia bacterium]|nr:hypothetical protein FACS189481_3560 [Clostridia bacterium]